MKDAFVTTREDAEIAMDNDGWNVPGNPWPKVERMEKSLREIRRHIEYAKVEGSTRECLAAVERLCKEGLAP